MVGQATPDLPIIKRADIIDIYIDTDSNKEIEEITKKLDEGDN